MNIFNDELPERGRGRVGGRRLDDLRRRLQLQKVAVILDEQ